MAIIRQFTAKQRSILVDIIKGVHVRRVGRAGYAAYTPDGRWIEKTSIAAKSLQCNEWIAQIDDKRRMYVTSRAYYVITGRNPEGADAELCKLADARVEYVRSMTVETAV